MSEKEIRETLQVLHDEFYVKEVGFIDQIAEAVYLALEEEPDVVKMLRWLRHQEEHTNHPDEWKRQDTYGSAARAVELQFHVRLMGDGWEWTEEDNEQGRER
jgi:hypothetical protein